MRWNDSIGKFILIMLLGLPELLHGQIFEDVSLQSNLDHSYGIGFACGGVSFCDFDGDGWDDITLASQNGDPISFFKNNQGVFEKIPSLISEDFDSKQILWIDFDNDGDKDLFVTFFNEVNRLYRNDGQLNLSDITQEAGLSLDESKSFGATWGDYDNDGYLDLFVSNRSPTITTSGSNNLYRNLGDGTFEETTAIAGVADPGKEPFSVIFLDYDRDNDQDIYMAQDRGTINTLFRNNGNGTFNDVSIASNANLQMDGMGIAVGDYDRNGYPDIYITNIQEGNKLLKNQGDGTFSEVADANGLGFFEIGWGTVFFDYDHDLDYDLYVSGAYTGSEVNSSTLYRNTGSGFEEPTDVGFIGDTVTSYANATGDFNNDGFPDIVVNNFSPYSAQLWKNSGNSNNWLKIELEGVESNRDGIGTLIEWHVQGDKYIKTVHSAISYLGQNSQYQLISAGTATALDSLIVIWPSGTIDKIYNISVNQRIKILEGSSLLPPSITVNGFTTLCQGDTLTLHAGYYDNYLWTTGEVTALIKVHAAGNYGVSVSNNSGGSGEDSVEIQVIPSPQLQVSSTPSGSGNTGTAKVIISGGTPPYIVQWNDPDRQTTEEAVDLSEGNYKVLVTDTQGCIKEAEIEVELVNASSQVIFDQEISIHPNPANRFIEIKFESPKMRYSTLKIVDLMGKTWKILPLSGQKEIKLEVDSMPGGIYIFWLMGDVENTHRKVIIN